MTIATGEQALASDVALGANMPSGAIIIWTGTIANIPSGWVICDGNNSTPNLLKKFVRGVATAATDPGTTSSLQHVHSYSWGSQGTTDTVSALAAADYGYYDVAYIMKS